jgi:hypothetical protein
MPLYVIYWLFAGTCCSYAFLRGGTPERLGAAAILIGSALSVVESTSLTARFHSAESGILGVDIVLLVALLILSLLSKRYWPLWTTGFHTVGVITHMAVYANPATVPRAYALAQGLWAYPMLLTVVLGSWNYSRKKKKDTAPNSSKI